MLIGVVGKANVGKSTFFKASTLSEVEIANYPFTTIDKNEGVGFVKSDCVEKDFNVKCNPKFGYCMDKKRFVPVKIIDVAGLVPGAHEGKGRGNQFLDDLRQADVLIHVIDVSGSTNDQGDPVKPGSYNPSNDIKFLEFEIDMWFFGLLKKSWEKFARQVKQEREEIVKAVAKQFSGLKVTEDLVKELIGKLNLGNDPTSWSDDNLKDFAKELRKRTKPMIVACNKIDVHGAVEKFKNLKKEFPDHLLIACSSESELALREAAKHEMIKYVPGENNFEITDESKLDENQKRGLKFLKHFLENHKTTGVQNVLDETVFNLLKHIVVYPVATNKLEDKDGNILPDAFLVPENTTAVEFAYKIHSDIGDNFIKAVDLKTKQVIGKDHVLKNNDVVEIIVKK
ncbi:redox-regulated ATPase YchF [Candidatus Woesearchaeota archaeon]|nr:redox-regulated ATPase YchF [Candidatus Woesearchaeota archaeon]